MYLASGTGEDFFTLSSSYFADWDDLSSRSAEEDCCMDCLLEPVEVCKPYTLRDVVCGWAVGRFTSGGLLKAYTSSSDPARSLGDGMDADCKETTPALNLRRGRLEST